ncbi:TGRM2 protein, partial [Indicator maculatus]|nr:TGRM2 protein [Indicator maculatus]
AVEETHKLEELYKLLADKEFQARIHAVMLLLDHCRNIPEPICNNIVQVFDAFFPRLQDWNKKVKQKALEVLALMIPLLRDALQPVLFFVVSAVTDNLNSKHPGIYAAA